MIEKVKRISAAFVVAGGISYSEQAAAQECFTTHASYYANKFHGRKTASGERFNMHALTAAHKTLKFGTKLKVTNTRNGESVVVRVNDRGPFIRGRGLDLSKAAASEIDLIKSGTGSVRVCKL